MPGATPLWVDSTAACCSQGAAAGIRTDCAIGAPASRTSATRPRCITRSAVTASAAATISATATRACQHLLCCRNTAPRSLKLPAAVHFGRGYTGPLCKDTVVSVVHVVQSCHLDVGFDGTILMVLIAVGATVILLTPALHPC